MVLLKKAVIVALMAAAMSSGVDAGTKNCKLKRVSSSYTSHASAITSPSSGSSTASSSSISSSATTISSASQSALSSSPTLSTSLSSTSSTSLSSTASTGTNSASTNSFTSTVSTSTDSTSIASASTTPASTDFSTSIDSTSSTDPTSITPTGTDSISTTPTSVISTSTAPTGTDSASIDSTSIAPASTDSTSTNVLDSSSSPSTAVSTATATITSLTTTSEAATTTSAAAPTCPTTNAVRNWSFEDMSYWSYNIGGTQTWSGDWPKAKDGSGGFRAPMGSGEAVLVTQRSVPLTQGKRYRAELWYAVDVKPPASGCKITFTASTAAYSFTANLNGDTPVRQWLRSTSPVAFTASEAMTDVQIQITCRISGNFFVDAVSVVEDCSEPGSPTTVT